jgi:ubiquinone/menaquinone biosynthesis C-methylase UbiE
MFCSGKTVLDIACGEGYGTNLLSKFAKTIAGVDIDKQTVVEAKLKYSAENIQFAQGDTSNIPFPDSTFDVVVSFETIEHHDKHDEMITEIKRVLKPDGVFIISTPDKYVYTDLKGVKNKFHVKELYKKEFVELIKRFFSNTTILNQKFITGSYIYNESSTTNSPKIWYSGNFNKVEQTVRPEGEYTIVIASNAALSIPTDLEKESFFIESNFIDKLTAQFKSLSIRYKVGYAVLSPLRILKNIFVKPGK